MIPTATSVGGAKYLLVLIDQFTSFLEIVPRRHIHPTIVEVSIPHFVNVCKNAFGMPWELFGRI